MIINAAATVRQSAMGHYGASGSWHGGDPSSCMKCQLDVQTAQQRDSIRPTNLLRRNPR